MIKSIVSGAAAIVIGAVPLAVHAQEAATATATATIDPARLAAAKAVVEHIFPAGTYARLMNASMQAVSKSAVDSVSQMQLRDLAAMGGQSPETVAKLGSGTLQEIMAIYDPVYRQRMEVTMGTMMSEMTKVMVGFEPAVRDGVGQAYANRFTTDQLGEMNRFFETPTGKAYAAESMVIMTDPAVMAKIQQFMPELSKQMPDILKSVQAATATLPKPRKYVDLSAVDRSKLAKLLGITEAQLAKENQK
ncbi:MAG: DUF2059 domain-containing protein [Proteobacteria bacterium]|nr:DUF2059 domain-containing protein [Pseudomonadota bacterium]